MFLPVFGLREISLFDETLVMERGFIRTAFSYNADRNEVRLFELTRAEGEERASAYLYQLCRLVLLSCFPNRRLEDLRWSYRNGFFSTALRFRSFSHGVTVMRLSNTLGLNAGGGTVAEYENGYYQYRSDVRMPARPATYYILWSPVTGGVSYLVRENGMVSRDYTIVFADAAVYATTIRRAQPLIFQTAPELMEEIARGGGGSRLSQALAMTKMFFRASPDPGGSEAGILTNPIASLGLLAQNHAVIPVLARKGAEARALRRLCGVRLRPLASAAQEEQARAAGGSAA
jgi:hypothetical protein